MRQDLNKTTKQMAREHYIARGESLDDEIMEHYKADGSWVIDVPYAFGMGYFYKDEEGIVLYVSYASGDLGSLLRYCLNIVIDKIEFKRNFIGRTKRYDYNKFVSRVNNG